MSVKLFVCGSIHQGDNRFRDLLGEDNVHLLVFQRCCHPGRRGFS